MRQICEEDHCLVAHTFEEGTYSDAQEVVWLAADIESKLEVDVDVARAWCERFESLANQLGFSRIQIWLISNEGFSEEASRLLITAKSVWFEPAAVRTTGFACRRDQYHPCCANRRDGRVSNGGADGRRQ